MKDSEFRNNARGVHDLEGEAPCREILPYGDRMARFVNSDISFIVLMQGEYNMSSQ